MDFDNPKEGPVVEVIKLKQGRSWLKYIATLIAVISLFSGLYFVSKGESNAAEAFRAAIVKTFKGASGSGQLVATIDANKSNGEVKTGEAGVLATIYTPNNKTDYPGEASPVYEEQEIPVILIEEIMYDLPGSDSGKEWIEIRNAGDTGFELSKLSLYENKTAHKIKPVQGLDELAPKSLAVVAEDAEEFLKDNPTYQGNLFDSTFSLSNDGEIIAFKKADQEITRAEYSSEVGANGDGNSLQLINNIWIAFVPTPGH